MPNLAAGGKIIWQNRWNLQQSGHELVLMSGPNCAGVRLAAAKHDRTVRQYVLEAIEERLREDLGDENEAMLALTAKTDPVLAELWDNKKDAEYDRL